VEGGWVAMENREGRVVHVEELWMGRCEGCCWYEHEWSWLCMEMEISCAMVV
jgi:hypothetical protein